MRAANATLISALLARTPMQRANLFNFQLLNGTFLYLTDYSENLTVNGNLYIGIGMGITRSNWSVKNTPDVQTMTLKLNSNGADYAGANIKKLIHNGLLDGAVITMYTLFMTIPGNASLGTVLIYGGSASTITLDALGATITVKGDNVLMQQNMPRNEYKMQCIHKLYDSGCTLSKAAYTITNTVGSGFTPTVNQVAWGSVPSNPQYYLQGVITFTSGAAAGSSRTVNAANSSGVGFSYPLYAAPAVGDTFSIYRGCDHTKSGGCTSFSNTQNFRGFLSIPPVETAL